MVDKKKVKFGKNVLETLTTGAYEDSQVIYREYIQNSADQIDKAVELGLLRNRSEGNIFITINLEERCIIIEDNATGIESSQVYEMLGNVADSIKDRSKSKGFRGIGRLGGLAYCDKLLFETSFRGEKIKSSFTWDAQKLRAILEDDTTREDVIEVIESVTDLKEDIDDESNHYFKVTLFDVNDDDLLDHDLIKEYLSMVAPLPFESHYIFKSKIHEFFNNIRLPIDEYKIYLNTEQLFKGYRTTIKDSNGVIKDEIFEIRFQEFLIDNQISAILWYGVSKTIEQISAKFNNSRGIRLRKGNIQIGSEYTLRKLFKDARFHFYFTGEVHVFHKRLIPNTRRDYFNYNHLLVEFEKQLSEYFSKDLHSLTYIASNINSANKKLIQLEELSKTIETKSTTGVSTKKDITELEKKFTAAKEQAEKAKKDLEKIKEKYSDDDIVGKIYEKVVNKDKISIEEHQRNFENKNGKIPFRTDKLTKLSRQDRKLISKVFKVIDEKLTPELAENIKYWIEEEFK